MGKYGVVYLPKEIKENIDDIKGNKSKKERLDDFFKVLKKLRFIGLVKKQHRFYYLTTEFPNALRRLERAIRTILKPKLNRIGTNKKEWEESQYV